MSEKKNSAILKAERVMNDKDLLCVENANESEIALLFVNSLVVVAILAIGGVGLYFFVIKKKLSGSKKENTPADPKK